MKPKNIRGLRIKHVIWIFALPSKIAREEIKKRADETLASHCFYRLNFSSMYCCVCPFQCAQPHSHAQIFFNLLEFFFGSLPLWPFIPTALWFYDSMVGLLLWTIASVYLHSCMCTQYVVLNYRSSNIWIYNIMF